jgi:hypothetical protein
MILKNVEVESLIKFLMELELKGRDSRLRTRFVKLLMERQNLIDEEHQQLVKQYSSKDSEGNPNIIIKEGKQFYDVEDKVGFNREYYILLNEEYIIEETEERKEMLLLLKDIILNCEKTFMGGEALEYDRWCEMVEEINYDK